MLLAFKHTCTPLQFCIILEISPDPGQLQTNSLKRFNTSRQTIVTVGVVQLPVLVEEIWLRRWLDVEKWSGVLVSLLSATKWLFASICRKHNRTIQKSKRKRLVVYMSGVTQPIQMERSVYPPFSFSC